MSKLTIVLTALVCAAAALLFADVRWITPEICVYRMTLGPYARLALVIWSAAGLMLLVAVAIDVTRRRWPAFFALSVAPVASVTFGSLAVASSPICGGLL